MSLLTLFDNPEFQQTLSQALNDNIDIPFINEETEGLVFQSLMKTIVDVIKAY